MIALPKTVLHVFKVRNGSPSGHHAKSGASLHSSLDDNQEHQAGVHAFQGNVWVFFDRGLIGAAAGLQHLTGEPVLQKLGQSHRYHRRVFLAPPWPEI